MGFMVTFDENEEVKRSTGLWNFKVDFGHNTLDEELQELNQEVKKLHHEIENVW
jgi:hypothetical protein